MVYVEKKTKVVRSKMLVCNVKVDNNVIKTYGKQN